MSDKNSAPAASEAKAEEATSKKPKKEKREDVSLPFLAELVFQFSGFFLLLITLSVALISFLSGANFVEIFVRTGISIIVTGILLLVLSDRVSQGVLQAAEAEKQSDAKAVSGLGGNDVKA